MCGSTTAKTPWLLQPSRYDAHAVSSRSSCRKNMTGTLRRPRPCSKSRSAIRGLRVWNRSGGRAAGDARRAAAAQRLDERALGRRRIAGVGPQQVDRASDRLEALDAEGDQLAAGQLVGDD